MLKCVGHMFDICETRGVTTELRCSAVEGGTDSHGYCWSALEQFKSITSLGVLRDFVRYVINDGRGTLME